LIGPLGLDLDKFIRTVGIPRAAKEYVNNLSEKEKNSNEMYADGINKAVSHMKIYPAEFYFFWVDFEPWTPIDSASLIYFLTFVLS
jgi:penicillin amidase